MFTKSALITSSRSLMSATTERQVRAIPRINTRRHRRDVIVETMRNNYTTRDEGENSRGTRARASDGDLGFRGHMVSPCLTATKKSATETATEVGSVGGRYIRA